MKLNNKYWDINKTWNYKCKSTGKHPVYTVCFGMRSNGKTYGALKKGLEEYARNGSQMAILRTWADDFKGKRGANLFVPLIENGVIADLFEDEYNTIIYKSQQWFLAKIDEESKVTMAYEPFAFAFALTQMQHDKSFGSGGKIRLIVFDEFISAGYMMDNAFDLFQNCISTIVRDRTDARIYLLGNTMSSGFFSPFLEEMGINPRQLKQGSITEYTYADNKELTVVVEYCDAVNRSDEQNKYFAFGRSSSSGMITSGEWALPVYRRLPKSIDGIKVKCSVFIRYKESLIQFDVLKLQKQYIIFAHKKTTPIRKPEKDIIYDIEYTGVQRNIIKNIFIDTNNISLKLLEIMKNKNIYYSDNYTGEVIRNWLHDCLQSKNIVK